MKFRINGQKFNLIALTVFFKYSKNTIGDVGSVVKYISKHIQTKYTEDIEEKSVFHIHQG